MRVTLAVVVRQCGPAVGFDLSSCFGSRFHYAMYQANPWIYSMHRKAVFDYWYR